jgi:hypothetical protein
MAKAAIEDGQTTQWPKEEKMIYKIIHRKFEIKQHKAH